ncbi:hypothetical protein Dimus_038399 [Dionaea muscipula]
MMFDRFMRMNPTGFYETIDAVKANNWIRGVEKLLKRICCPIERRVPLATYMLKDVVEYWWSSVERRYQSQGDVITWRDFVAEFEAKFYSESLKAEKKAELLTLRQDGLNVAEYDVKMTELSRFAPELVMTEKDRMFLFLQGLDPDMQTHMRVVEYPTLAAMVARASSVEAGFLHQKSIGQKRPSDVPLPNQGSKGSGQKKQQTSQS